MSVSKYGLVTATVKMPESMYIPLKERALEMIRTEHRFVSVSELINAALDQWVEGEKCLRVIPNEKAK